MKLKSIPRTLLCTLISMVLIAPFSLSRNKPPTESCGFRNEPMDVVMTALPNSLMVTNLSDSGVGSLRQAIDDSNNNAGMDTITFSVSGTITLTSGVLNIEDDVAIIGPGAASLTINGNNTSGVLRTSTIVMISELSREKIAHRANKRVP